VLFEEQFSIFQMNFFYEILQSGKELGYISSAQIQSVSGSKISSDPVICFKMANAANFAWKEFVGGKDNKNVL
jgi:hypothetical protein